MVVGYAWTWDLRGCGLDAARVTAALMARLFEPFGFREHATNEPNLCLKRENLFLTRIGATRARRRAAAVQVAVLWA